MGTRRRGRAIRRGAGHGRLKGSGRACSPSISFYRAAARHPDAVAVEALDAAIRGGAGTWGLFARHEGERALDDVMVREYYKEWSRFMNRPAHLPVTAG